MITVLDDLMADRKLEKQERDSLTRQRNYYATKEWTSDQNVRYGLRLHVDADTLIDTGELILNFELIRATFTVHGAEMRKRVREAGLAEGPNLTLGTSGSSGYCHIAVVQGTPDRNKPLKEGLDELLNATIFKNDGILIRQCLTWLSEIHPKTPSTTQ
ncbi:MAG: hypothetical protein IPO56_16635 [Flavobacteriales bacterium]|nr:hypothetical protein [Flavobacteriales bacterium]